MPAGSPKGQSSFRSPPASSEKELLDLAKHHTTGVGEGKLSKDGVVDLFKSANDGQGVTDTEKATLQYIRNNFVFTDAAAADFDKAFAEMA